MSDKRSNEIIFRAIAGERLIVQEWDADYYVDVTVPDLGPTWTALQMPLEDREVKP